MQFEHPGVGSDFFNLDLPPVPGAGEFVVDDDQSLFRNTHADFTGLYHQPNEFPATMPLQHPAALYSGWDVTNICTNGQHNLDALENNIAALTRNHCHQNQTQVQHQHQCQQRDQNLIRFSADASETQEVWHAPLTPNGKAPFICVCDGNKTFTRLDTLRRHIKSKNGEGKRLPCPLCEKYDDPRGFLRREHLVQHLRREHKVGNKGVELLVARK